MSTEPKFAQIAATLRQRILDGTYTVGSRLPSENLLPADFGVGKQTIVRVMAELLREGLIVRQRGRGTFVLGKTATNQQPQDSKRALRVGVVFRKTITRATILESSWFTRVLHGMSEELGQPREGLQLDQLPTSDTSACRISVFHPASENRIEIFGEPPATDSGTPLNEIFSANLDGVLPFSIFDDAYLNGLLDRAELRKVPVVLVDYWTRELGARVDCVVADNLPGYHGACEWLLKSGLRRIYFLGVYSASHTPGRMKQDATRGRVEPDSYLRLSAYQQALHEADVGGRSEWVHFCHNAGDTEQLAEKLCTLPKDKRPEAILCHGSEMAESVSRVFSKHRWSLPVLGVSVEPPTQRPAITLNAEEIGRAAVAALKQRIQERSTQPRIPIKIAVPTQFLSE